MDNHDEDIQIGASLETLARHVSERWRQELTALRAALDQQISSIDARLDESNHGPVIQATVKNISQVATERADRARQQAEAAAAQALAAIEAQLYERLGPEIAANAVLRTSLDDAQQQLASAQDSAATAEAARTATEAQHRETLKENRKLTTVLDEAQAQLLDAQAQLKNAQREAEGNRVSLAAVQQQSQALAADRAALQQGLKDVTAVKATAEAQYQQLVAASRKLTDALSQMQREREHVRMITTALPTRGESAHDTIASLKTASSTSTPSTNPTPATFDPSASASKKPLQFSEPARDAKRVKIRRGIQANVDGIPGELVDLSIGGAQALLTRAVRPNQLVRLTLPNVDGPITCKGRIVWAVYEQPGTSLSVYRTGVKFTDVDAMAVERFMNDFCEKPTLVQSRHSSGVA
jgi:hypothetical protein